MKSEYKERFLRHIGIMNEEGLRRFKNGSVAIAGLGVGGSIFINLVRMGFEKFHIADPDLYERTNINRQRLAKETTIGCRKDDCLLQEARSINPDIQVKSFRDGVTESNVKEFLKGMDWVVDAVDLFAIPAKIELHREARKLGIPVFGCGAIGFGGIVFCFDSSTPSFEEVTGVSKNSPYLENAQRLVDFIAPKMPAYMAEQVGKALRGESHIPFMVSGVEITSALTTAEIAKHVLGLGKKVLAPQVIHVDPVEHTTEIFAADFRKRRKKAA